MRCNSPKSLVQTAIRISLLLQGLQASGGETKGEEKERKERERVSLWPYTTLCLTAGNEHLYANVWAEPPGIQKHFQINMHRNVRCQPRILNSEQRRATKTRDQPRRSSGQLLLLQLAEEDQWSFKVWGSSTLDDLKTKWNPPTLKPFRVSTVTPHQSSQDRGQGQGAGEDFKDFFFKGA